MPAAGRPAWRGRNDEVAEAGRHEVGSDRIAAAGLEWPQGQPHGADVDALHRHDRLGGPEVGVTGEDVDEPDGADLQRTSPRKVAGLESLDTPRASGAAKL